MKRAFPAVAAVALLTVGCTSRTPSAISEDKAAASQALDTLNDAQPTPQFRWSQIRQNLIEIQTAQAQTTQTTTFFFNQGVPNPVKSCPSIGYPIPTTAQLTNPQQAIGDIGDNGSGAVIAQIEQTGIYTGDSTGTYVICIDAQGNAYGSYWEGFVETETGPAEWDPVAGQIKLIGPPSFDFSETE